MDMRTYEDILYDNGLLAMSFVTNISNHTFEAAILVVVYYYRNQSQLMENYSHYIYS